METCLICQSEFYSLKSFKCRFCTLHFCSLNCLISHSSIHEFNNDKAKDLINSAKRRYSKIQLKNFSFISNGIFHNTIEYDTKKYNLQNFYKLTDDFIPIELGSGAYGHVYLVSDNENKKYALKVINKNKINRFFGNCDIVYNEIDIHSKLEHKNIIKLYNTEETEDEINILLEYASKGNLYNLITENKGFNEEKSFEFFIQIVDAVYFLHMNQIIHRDIKPENILITEDNILKLSDFGSAKNLTLKKRNSFCGTVEYMAPEIIGSENYDFSVDIWSLGILLYELLMGYSPFKDKNAKTIMTNIKMHELKYEKNISEDCKDLINKLLEVNPEKRINIKDILSHKFIQNNVEKKNFFTPLHSENIEDNDSDDKKNKINKSINIMDNIRKNYFQKEKNNRDENFKNKDDSLEKIRKTITFEVEKSKEKLGHLSYKKCNKFSFEDFRDGTNSDKFNKNKDKFKKKLSSEIPNNSKKFVRIITTNYDEFKFEKEDKDLEQKLQLICSKYNVD